MIEYDEISNLLNAGSQKNETLNYKEVNRVKINNENNGVYNSNRITFNTSSIASKLISYENAYIQLEVDIKFTTQAEAIKTNLLLKNSYEMINEFKIELNNQIISNEINTNYSYLINHILDNGKNDNLIYRGIKTHTSLDKYADTSKDIFMTKNGDTIKVIYNIFLKDISSFFNNLNFPINFGEFNLTFKIADEIYITDKDITSQVIKNCHLFVDSIELHDSEKIAYLKSINNFNKTIPILENFVKIDRQNITNNQFDIFINNVRNCNDIFFFLVDNTKDIKLSNKSVKNLQLYIDNQKFQTNYKNNTDAFIELKSRSKFTDEFILDYNQFENTHLIYSFPMYRHTRNDKGNKYINLQGIGVNNTQCYAVVIYRQFANVNLKIENNSLQVFKSY